ncbi:MAG: hypothetical protein ACOYYS_02850 [Chloroflexota bacterium]
MSIESVLGRAWQITWKYKILWLFGILASCGGGSSGGSSGGGGGGNGSSSAFLQMGFGTYRANILRLWRVFVERVGETEPWITLLVIAVVFTLALILIALALALNTIGRIGLIRGTCQAENGVERLSLSELFKGGLPYFWRVLALGLLLGIGALLVGSLLLLPIGLVTCGIGFLLFLPFVWFVAVWIEQASAAVVAEDAGIADGLRKGWEIIRDNLGTIIVMSLILYLLLGLLVGLLLTLPAILLAFPLILGAMTAAMTQAPFAFSVGMLITVALLAVYIPLAVLLNGILRTYIGSAWTLTYLRLRKASPRLEEMPVL